MPLQPGTRLGHYDVTSLLGEGGMGQVSWQATDTQLGRQVALKVLPDAFAAGPDRLARFEREAKVLASLNSSRHRTAIGRAQNTPVMYRSVTYDLKDDNAKDANLRPSPGTSR